MLKEQRGILKFAKFATFWGIHSSIFIPINII